MKQKIMRYQTEIEASHPETSTDPLRYVADQLAMELVGERDSKRDLVNLVRWLITDNARSAAFDVKRAFETQEEEK